LSLTVKQNSMFMLLLFFLQEAERLEPTEDPSGCPYIDYSEKRSLPISVPDYHYSEKAGERYVVIRSICVMRFSSFKFVFVDLTTLSVAQTI
jgi:sorting nexin-27